MWLDRKEIKSEAKEFFKEYKKESLVASLLVIILSFVSSFVPSKLLSSNKAFVELSNLNLENGMDLTKYNEAWQNVISDKTLLLSLGISFIVIILFSSIIEYLFSNTFRRIVNEEEIDDVVITSVKSIFKTLGMNLFMFLKLLAWSLLMFLPVILGGVLLYFFPSLIQHQNIIMIVTYALMFVVYILVLRAALSYSQGIFLLDMGNGPVQSINKSKEVMKGNLLEYIVFSLSFLGWLLLWFVVFYASILSPLLLPTLKNTVHVVITVVGLIISVIGLMYLMSYIKMSEANWFIHKYNETYDVDEEDGETNEDSESTPLPDELSEMTENSKKVVEEEIPEIQTEENAQEVLEENKEVELDSVEKEIIRNNTVEDALRKEAVNEFLSTQEEKSIRSNIMGELEELNDKQALPQTNTGVNISEEVKEFITNINKQAANPAPKEEKEERKVEERDEYDIFLDDVVEYLKNE